MSNTNINSITQKLLNKEISLKDLTLEKFREGRTIYSTMREAQCKGFEAHHLLPVSAQKNSENFDDRCYRYTPFEHVIDHYLLGRENPEYIHVFECMTRFNLHHLMKEEQALLEGCIEFSELRKQGVEKIRKAGMGNHHALGHVLSEESKKKISESNRKYYQTHSGPRLGSKMTEANKEALRRVNLGNSYHKGFKHSEEARRKMSEKARGRKHGPMSEETKQKLREANLGQKRSEEVRKKISDAKKGKAPWNKGKKTGPAWNKGKKMKPLSEEGHRRRAEMLAPRKAKYRELKAQGIVHNWNEFQSALKRGEIQL